VDNSNRVGIGTSSPSVPLTVNGGSDNLVGMFESSDTLSYISFKDSGTTSSTSVALGASGDNFTVYTGTSYGSERMRIDASGNLLVGTTSAYGTTGTTINAAGLVYSSADGDRAGQFDRTTSDGELVRFSKAGTTVGSIGTDTSGNLQTLSSTGNYRFGDSNTSRWSVDATRMYPMLDATYDIGLSSVRVRDLYLSGGVYLGGTGSANKLDDYEEGTWTPALASDASVSSFTYRVGYYTKVGRKVHVTGQFKIANMGSFAGATININGLPFNIANVTTYDPTGILVIKGAAVAKSGLYSRGVANTNYARIEQGNGNVSHDMNCNANVFDTDTICYFDLTYFTS
jgi:hypothetical protein